ncbi:hypothetical protein GQ42DRAFT_27135 [Ramicandelaber brevisporus]|nr:hypothetical protein GQ42DRAFT_27135 [Ramicandelaber brevisporus]
MKVVLRSAATLSTLRFAVVRPQTAQLTARYLCSTLPTAFQRSPLAARQSRLFSTTSASRALYDNDDIPPKMRKMLEHPELRQNMAELVQLLSRKGVDVTGRTEPSFTQLFKLMADTEVRDLLNKIQKGMNEAGITLDMNDMKDMFSGKFTGAAAGKGKDDLPDDVVNGDAVKTNKSPAGQIGDGSSNSGNSIWDKIKGKF